MIDPEATAQVKTAMLRAQTLAQLHALIIKYTHQEMLGAYKELAPEQQEKIQAIYERDSQPSLDWRL